MHVNQSKSLQVDGLPNVTNEDAVKV